MPPSSIAVALALLLASPLIQASPPTVGCYNAQVLRLTDGDTLKVDLTVISAGRLSLVYQGVALRVRGVDTPESGWRAQCRAEQLLGDAAKLYARLWARTAERQVIACNLGVDKYGGRLVADVYHRTSGERLGDALSVMGLAQQYDGGRKRGWCGAAK